MKPYIVFFVINIFLVSLSLGTEVQNISRMKWGDLEVVWIKNDRLPTYNFTLYFADGALSDGKNAGETEAMFSLINSGTNRYSFHQLSDALEYYGVGIDTNVTHEYSTLSFSGLVKDIVPTSKMVCHMFKDTIFPKKELNRYKKRFKSHLHNIASSPSSLASKIFRKLSMTGTHFSEYVGGTRKSIDKINQKSLEKKLDYFKNKVFKRLYISGPDEVSIIKNVVNNECGFQVSDNLFKRNTVSEKKFSKKNHIYFIPINNQTQAQIRIGRFLNKKEINDLELMRVSSSLLGEGFTSKLMQELRVKRGLTYGAYAFAVPQKNYGRVGIITSTQNKNIVEMISQIKTVLSKKGMDSITSEELKRNLGRMYGAHLFELETDASFLNKIMYYDHIKRDQSEIFSFHDKITKISKNQIIDEIQKNFNWEKQTIVVVGDRKLLPTLKKLGKVNLLKYQDLL